MRILHVINGELYSGAERVQDLLALGLHDLGFEVGFACIKPDKFPERRMAKDAPLHLVPMNSRFDLACGLKLARIVRQEGYRLVHTHTPRAALVGRVASLLAGVPMVHHVHSPTSRDTEDAMRNRINTLMEGISLTGVAKLIPVSQSLDAYLRGEGYGPDKIRMVANGVPTPGPLPERAPPGGEWVIGSVALFRPRKGIEVLMEAVATLRKQGRAVRLRAVGPFETQEYEATILALADRLGIREAIDWTGFTRDVNAEFARMDAFVLPSLFGEGMPMVILEAMAMGVPVAASDVEGIPEVLEHGRSGLVVPAADAASLASALADLMDGRHDWKSMREAAYAAQRSRFSDRSMAEGVAKVYREVLG
ncbi:MAG: glycosyltransferase [Pseudomonadota bacterium]